ncbi:hypothetical protein AUP68_02431 [Ilyonectria robusta]
MIDFDLASELAVLVLGKIDGAGGCTVGDALLMINFCDHFMLSAGKTEQHLGQVSEEDVRRDVAATTVLPEGYLLLHTAESRAKVQIFAQRVYQDYSSGLPQPGYLHVLIRLNVLNALAQNAALLEFRFKGLCFPELVSPFNQHGPSSVHTFIPSQAYPSWLQPTALQMTVRHHPWIDLIPIPRMRDNILCALEAGFLDNKELGIDILGVEDIQGDTASLIIWGEPWDPRGWELGPFMDYAELGEGAMAAVFVPCSRL